MSMEVSLKELPIEVGEIFEGERIRWKDTFVELGGGKIDKKFELVQARDASEIEDGKIIVVGKKFEDLEPQKSHSFGLLVEIAGPKAERDLEAVFERRLHEFTNFAQGVMHLNQRYDIHIRVSKSTKNKGFTFDVWGKILYKFFKEELGIFEKMQITFFTDPNKVAEKLEKALQTYKERDDRARSLRDEDVDTFYGCILCQSFAPTHVCVVTPDRISSCGALNWFDTRAAAQMDPEGPNFAMPKGEILDAERGEYSGVNEKMIEKSLGEVERVQIHSLFGKTHTSCGCFEACSFIIPEVDGIGVVHRDFVGETVNGLEFGTMATQVGGGVQTEGFVGIAVEYLRSPKFFEPDGGLERLVWLPKGLKERVRDSFPEDLVDKIATEEDVSDVNELKSFLKERDHPIVNQWVEEEVVEDKELVPVGEMSTMTLPLGSAGGSTIKLVLKNVKIHAEKVLIVRSDKK
ncbi:MAG: CO dehydrogenase/CO-methylating acetyl-CoA synthase complex subunit beta [Candidatus Hodarchaeales archaeon]|jgi:acetyl-CoA decarbonylase/synthase complex subunit beta